MTESAQQVGGPTRTTESAQRVSGPTRTTGPALRVSGATRSGDSYGRTDVRTNEELLDQRGHVTYHNAHENHDQNRAPTRADALTARGHGVLDLGGNAA